MIFFLQRVFVDFSREGGGEGGGQELWAREFSQILWLARCAAQERASNWVTIYVTRRNKSADNPLKLAAVDIYDFLFHFLAI